MRIKVLSLLVFIFALSPLPASAFSLTGQSITYFQYREAFDSTKLAPIHEYLDLSVQDTGMANVSFHFGGWIGYKSKEDEGFDKKYDNDLQYAYLSFRNNTANTLVNLGRLYVIEGVAMEQVDGIYAATDLKGGFRVAAFGGRPVETDFNNQAGDSIYGGRITHSIPALYKIGLSYLRENGGSTDHREETGVDIWFLPLKKIQILGRSSYNLNTSGWMEHAYYAAVGPFANFRLSPQVSWIDYKSYFTSATSSVFDLTKGSIDPNEKVLILGAEAEYAPVKNLAIKADYRNFNYDLAGKANYYGCGVAYSVFQSGSAGLFFHRMDGETDKLKYYEFRAYASKKIGKADITANAFDIRYDSEIFGVKNAYAVSLAAGYDFTKAFRLAADMEYGRSPYFTKDVKAFLKLIYKFGFASPKKGA